MKRLLQLHPGGRGLLLLACASHLPMPTGGSSSLLRGGSCCFSGSGLNALPSGLLGNIFQGPHGKPTAAAQGGGGLESGKERPQVTSLCWWVFGDGPKTGTLFSLCRRTALGLSSPPTATVPATSGERESPPNWQDWPHCHTHIPTQCHGPLCPAGEGKKRWGN